MEKLGHADVSVLGIIVSNYQYISIEDNVVTLKWEQIRTESDPPKLFGVLVNFYVYRAKVPGGWLVATFAIGTQDQSITFYPDPNHEWDGNSLD